LSARYFRLLGPLEVGRRGEHIHTGPRRQRLILGVLVLEAGRFVSSDRLAELIWCGREPPRSARNAVHVGVSLLRSLVRDVVPIEASAAGYRVDVDPESVDVRRFRDLIARARDLDPASQVGILREAEGLWRGAVMEGTFTHELRHLLCAGLSEERTLATELRMDAELRLGRHRAIIGELTDLTRAYPTRERLVGQLMLALYRDGQAVRSLDAYRNFHQRLAAEFGMDPGPALRQLEVSILRHSIDRPLEGLAGGTSFGRT
jgi:DNA-binding SARP family transcriptional activator